MSTTGEQLLLELNATWVQARELIEGCPNEQWREGDYVYFVPARQMYHLIDCATILLGNPPKRPPTPKPFGSHWDGPVEALPSQGQLLDLLGRVEADARDWIGGLSESKWVDSDIGLSTEKTPLAHVVYAIRHNAYHLAIVNGEMRRRGLARMTWR